MKKILYLSLVSICIVSCASVITAFACSDEVKTRAPACIESMYYRPTSTTTKTVISDTGKIVNKSSASISKTISYSTTISSTASTQIKAEFGAIVAKVGVNAMVGLGESRTKTVSTTVHVKANSTVTYSLGHQNKVTSGSIVYRSGNCVETSKKVNSVYSFRYYDSVK